MPFSFAIVAKFFIALGCYVVILFTTVALHPTHIESEPLEKFVLPEESEHFDEYEECL